MQPLNPLQSDMIFCPCKTILKVEALMILGYQNKIDSTTNISALLNIQIYVTLSHYRQKRKVNVDQWEERIAFVDIELS